ncbi:HAMP domain-containing protein [Chitinilyticum piscinae]|uniref:Sensor protein n=1 Tax=Chitinilyticum piscinae TaxID=2866724 RepID=A0A8J7KDG1_9NEIS|nr:type IV pili methyl-accepting chemotaxis transducer N-terminal domain-containing protein [Chitinilyticum piscinae]MBE9608739.1 type IV pili methyl-accepting chemotaxis transducer N-terminal domain-containing protein [Chitinilyticum piscinae]
MMFSSVQLPRQRLSTRVLGFLMLTLMIGLSVIGSTLYLSWQLEGGAAAINAAGSLRKQTYQLGLSLQEYTATPGPALKQRILDERDTFRATLTLLDHGDPARPLYLPRDEGVREIFNGIRAQFDQHIAVWADDALQGKPLPAWAEMRADSDRFVAQVDSLVSEVERYNARRTLMLRLSQMVLIAMAVVGCVAQIYLMFLLIFRPLERLQDGMQRMAQQDLSVRLPVETRDEFGELAEGFNRMADRLSESYATLEARVADKTATLNDQNRELSLLYGSTAFLNEIHPAQELCRGFAVRLREWFGADAASVRVLDPAQQNAHLMIADQLPEVLQDAPQCRQINDCLCGEVVQSNHAVIHDFRRGTPAARERECEKQGFSQVSAFPIRARQEQTGYFNLYFSSAHDFTARELQLLDTLGHHLGNALENLRLAASERELAVTQERNLLAQGLHDSIAQGLSFLNLQVQMLEDSLRRDSLDEAREIVPLLHAGVQESYDDVRDLLLNFRSRLGEGDLNSALESTVAKFRRQTGMKVSFTSSGHGVPLPPDEQIQILFILQEALSNVRKHAIGADQVTVIFVEGPDLQLTVRDNGPGFDEALKAERAERHVGMRIMQERAGRVGAELHVSSVAGQGVTVNLLLPEARRHKIQNTTA